jgi:siroheme decarboxylase
MELSAADLRLLAALEGGLPLAARPYGALGEAAGMGEEEVLLRLARMQQDGLVKRLGLIVHHHEIGYRANAMVVWHVPEDEVDRVGLAMAACRDVTLCYRRRAHPPHWPYNLYCMIHGRARQAVLDRIEAIAATLDLVAYPHAVLFSTRRFKQRGARYFTRQAEAG